MSESGINAAITKHRAELARRERAALEQMAHAHAGVISRMAGELKALEAELQAIIDAGEVPTIGRLYRMERYRSLLIQAEVAFNGYAADIGAQLGRLSREAVRQAERDAGALALEALGPPPPGVNASVLFTKLPEGALEAIVGSTSNGPLADLLAQFGRMAAHDARAALIYGVALGEHPSKVARRIRDALNIPLHRAATIARTEQLRAYRESHRAWYSANRRVVKEWKWHSARGRNTCVMCWAMHGTTHPLDEPMGTHPNCRCAMVPVTKTWRELGYDVPERKDASVSITPGPVLFGRLKPAEQLHILGPRAFLAYRNGEVDITDFVHRHRSADWGITRSRASLKRALANAERR